MNSTTQRTPSEFSTTNLDQLQGQLSVWRRKQRGRPRLPEAVWQSAAALAQSMGVSQVSRRLRLDYYKLSRWRGQTAAPAADSAQRATFVQLALSAPSANEMGSEYRAELVEGRGRMTLHLGQQVSTVVALAEAFWRRGS